MQKVEFVDKGEILFATQVLVPNLGRHPGFLLVQSSYHPLFLRLESRFEVAVTRCTLLYILSIYREMDVNNPFK